MKAATAPVQLAHQTIPAGTADALRTWNLDPLVLGMLAAALAVYLTGAARLRGSTNPHSHNAVRDLLFLGGLASLAVALISPLDALSAVLFSAHMSQHLLLTAVAPPLLVLSRPSLPFRLGAPPTLRRIVSRTSWRHFAPLASSPAWAAGVLVGHAAVMWFWHAPPMYEAALTDPRLHALEHATMFGTALLIWALALAAGRQGLGVAALLFTAMQGVALGALLTISPRILYPSYRAPAWGLSALEHQQLGGLLMWVPTGVIYVGASLCTLGSWLRRTSKDASDWVPQPESTEV